MRVSFSGEIPEISGIAVDNFENTEKRAYFLSHCHADHTVGLKYLSNFLSETVFIYMSEPSAAIVENYINEDLKKFIKPLKMGTTTVTIPGDEENMIPKLYVSVTLIPAGHCFGSVMFLFETPLKKVLYTGDFRISENSVSKLAQLHHNNKPIKLDTLYVDTTFQSPIYDTFPKRYEVLDGVVREIQSWMERGEQYHVALVPSARYGYEDVLNKIYKRIGVKTYVDSNWNLYSEFLDRLPGVTNNCSEKFIHLCASNKYYCYCNTDTLNKYLYIKFSARSWKHVSSEDLTMVKNETGDFIFVCFSTHCSRSELVYFIEYLSPRKIVGFPDPYTPVMKPADVTPIKRKTPKSLEKNSSEMKKPKKVPKHILRQLFD